MSKILRLITLLVFVGLASGLLSSLFLYALHRVTDLRMATPDLIWGLPIFGFLFGLLLRKIPQHINQGVPYILQEIDNTDKKVSTLTAPFIFIASIGTHLFGGSAGREGVGVLMGASAAHVLPKLNASFREMRTHLIYAGVAAGFSSMFGTPLAGLIFAFEIHAFKELKRADLVFSTLASALIADRLTRYLGPNHHRYETFFEWDLSLIPTVVLAGILSGIGALIFYHGMKFFSEMIFKKIRAPEWKMFAGGLSVSLLIFFTGAYDFAGIGTHVLEKSFYTHMQVSDFFLKCLLTIITLSAGFKGGEVTPLFFMGATLSNSIMGLLNFRNYSLTSALGMIAIFSAVTRTPFASTIMACELFGWKIGLLALGVCLISKLFMRGRSIYRH